MTFTLYSLQRSHASNECFFAIYLDTAIFYSPFYPDQKSAFKAMEDLVKRLRDEQTAPDHLLVKKKQGYTLSLFRGATLLAGNSASFAQKSEAWEKAKQLQEAAQKRSFKLNFSELADTDAEVKRLSELEQENLEAPASWNEMGSSILRVDKASALPLSPAMGMQLGLKRDPCDPIFNVFQPYVAADLPLFHGRKRDVDDFYALSLQHPLLLLYGLTGVGKSSLLLCGLANRMESEECEMVYVRWQEHGILSALRDALQQSLLKGGQEEADQPADLVSLIDRVNELYGRPILIFDQLEELFQPHVEEEERREFFSFVQQLIDKEDLPCRIVFSLRESHLAPLADYEELIPTLLEQRYHLQPLKKKSMANLTFNLLDVLQLQKKATVEDPQAISEKISEELADENGDVPMHCLQMYLHQMHQATCKDANGAPPVFSSALVDSLGSPRDVINSYIDQEIDTLRQSAGEEMSPSVQRKIDDLNQSREQCGCPESRAVQAAASTAVVPTANAANEKKVRNLRRLLLIALLALLLSLIAYWLFYNWLQRQDPCQTTQQTDTCEAYINYLFEYGEETACAENFQTVLSERDCEVWNDYQLMQLTPTCGTYQDFFNKYRNTEVNTDQIRKALLDWECPIVRDTVTLRDTIIERQQPSTFNQLGSRQGSPSSNRGCKDIEGENFKRVGPLWMMTGALEGGPYTWEDALDACKAKGWRLPCIGEVDFLIENIYRGQGTRAYQMLTGSGNCYLINPSEVLNNRIDFWTGTEANDATAWTFFFDTSTKTIGRESNIPKSRRLPCLCVQKEDSGGVSGIPPCYQKNIDRRPG